MNLNLGVNAAGPIRTTPPPPTDPAPPNQPKLKGFRLPAFSPNNNNALRKSKDVSPDSEFLKTPASGASGYVLSFCQDLRVSCAAKLGRLENCRVQVQAVADLGEG